LKELFLFNQVCSTTQKPLEIYLFVDPLCPECWALEPILRKLQIEYGHYFQLKRVLSGSLATLNVNKKMHADMADFWEITASRTGMSCDGSLWLENPISSPYIAFIAIKAAELQGRKAGSRFLRKLQEVLFLNKKNISDIEVLTDCARDAQLDVNEFSNDIHSSSAVKAFQCDLKITSEMEVDEVPTMVFFNENIEDEGIKVSGLYSYEIYVQIIQEMLAEKPVPAELPPLEEFLKFFKCAASKEISVVYGMTNNEVDKEMKKLLLQQKVCKISAKHGTFWKYVE